MHPRRPALAFVVATAVLVLVGGCGGDDETSADTPATPTTSLTGPGTDLSENLSTGEEFIEALATNTAESLAQAQALTAPKSGAARYVADAQDALTSTAKPWTKTVLGEGRYRFCAGPDCTVLTDLVLLDGQVSTFKVDGKQLR